METNNQAKSGTIKASKSIGMRTIPEMYNDIVLKAKSENRTVSDWVNEKIKKGEEVDIIKEKYFILLSNFSSSLQIQNSNFAKDIEKIINDLKN